MELPFLSLGKAIRIPFYGILIAALISAIGCHGNVTDPGAPITIAASPDVQQQIETNAKAFLSAVHKGDAAGIETQLTAKPAQNTGGLQSQLSTYSGFKDISQVEFEPAQELEHGKKEVLRVHFLGANEITYYANFIFLRVGAKWQISSVVGPVERTKPPVAGDAGVSKS